MKLERSDLEHISNPGEQLTAKVLLKHAPKDWSIIYSKNYLRRYHDYKAGEDFLIEGEIDFIVMVPNLGFCCLEVKSARELKIEDGNWYRKDGSNWIKYSKTPVQQNRKNMHNLVELLKTRFPNNALPCSFASMIVFPRATANNPYPIGDDAVLIDKAKLNNIISEIKDVLVAKWEYYVTKINPRANSPITNKVFQLLLPKEVRIAEKVSIQINNSENALIALTEQQSQILGAMKRNKQLCVVGGAGTGKTILAIKRAQELMDSGLKIAFICYSRKLPFWIQSRLELKNGSVVNNYYKLAKEYIDKAPGLSLPKANPFENRPYVDGLFLEAIEILGDRAKFDVIIIDEAQDFGETKEIIFHELWNRNSAGFFIQFGDENQTIFSGGGLFTGDDIPICTLDKNCRNTLQIALICNAIISQTEEDVDVVEIESLPRGKDPIYINGEEGPEFRKEQIVKTIRGWIDSGINVKQIALIAPKKQNSLVNISNLRESASEVQSIEGIKFTSSHEKWRNNQGCLVDTIKGFKGMESDLLVLTDLPEITENWFTLEDAYVGISRAKHELVVISLTSASAAMVAKWMN